MEFRIISLPPFKAATSGVDTEFNFSPEGKLGKFDAFFSSVQPSPKERFMPRDFLYYDPEKQGMVWLWALTEDMNDGGFEVVDFEGGYYLTYAYKDGDSEADKQLSGAAMEYIKQSGVLELDIRPGHYTMGHVITPKEIGEAQGWNQMETFIPVKLL